MAVHTSCDCAHRFHSARGREKPRWRGAAARLAPLFPTGKLAERATSTGEGEEVLAASPHLGELGGILGFPHNTGSCLADQEPNREVLGQAAFPPVPVNGSANDGHSLAKQSSTWATTP